LVASRRSIPAHRRQRERRGFRDQDELAAAVHLEVVGEDLATWGGAGPGATSRVALAGPCILEISSQVKRASTIVQYSEFRKNGWMSC